METVKLERESKLPNVVMCGDHPSFTKTQLNLREETEENKEKEKDKKTSNSFVRVSSSASRTRAAEREAAPEPPAAPQHAELARAALGSFRWPPYLVCAWLLALALAHALHAALALLERALPPLRSACAWSRERAGAEWRAGGAARAAAAAALAAALHALCAGAAAARALAGWAARPLAAPAPAWPAPAWPEPAWPAPAGLAPRAPGERVTDYEDFDSQMSPRLKLSF